MDCSNRKLKNTLIASSVFLVPLIINKLVFFMAERKYPLNESFKTYDWRLGKVAYSVKGLSMAQKPVHHRPYGQKM